MSVVNNNLLLTAPDAAASSYQVSRSCRFNAPDTAYLSRTPSVAGNRKTYTLSLWEKRAALNAGDALFSTVSGSAFCYFSHGTGAGNDTINFAYYDGSSDIFALVTTAVYRDPSNWYHIVLSVDTTQATASNRVKIYVNGVQVTQFSSAAYPALNYDTPINSTISHILGGATSPYTSYLLSAYLADAHFIDGQALTPSSFTETNATTGQLVPKAYTGTYGTNGFRLNFSDNSAATLYTLGVDSRTDGALNGSNGTLVNGPTYSSANGGSIVFDGTNDYVQLTSQSLSSVDFSVEVWFSAVKAVSSQQVLFTSYNFPGGAQANTFILYISGSRIVAGNGLANLTGIATIATNTWYHAIATYTASTSTLTLYINGTSQGSAVQSITTGASSNFIGGSPGDNNLGTWWFGGNIPIVRAYRNKTLSASEVSQNYNALVGRFGGTSTGSIVTDGMVLNLDAGNTVSYPGTGTTWTDISLRKNNWTPNNLSVTAGVGNDSLTDTPTSYGTDSSGTGGVVRGNYATLNPLDNTATLSNGNLDVTWAPASYASSYATIAIPSTGSWYYECNVTASVILGRDLFIGISLSNGRGGLFSSFTSSAMYRYDGSKYIDTASTAYGASFTLGDVIGVAINSSSGQITFYKNGVSQGAISYSLSGKTMFPCIALYTASTSVNFGQRPFAYAAPSGFKALCDTNLPTPTIAKGSSVFDTVLYTGNSSTQSISTLNFSPDLIWGKARNINYFNTLQDTVRGAGLKILYPNSADAENAYGQNWINSFDSNGFSMLSGFYNQSTLTYAAWCWDAGSSTVTNTAGTITSQVRANPSAGFSVVTFTCPASGAYSFGHGLGVSPAMVIIKDRVIGSTTLWCVYHSSATSISQYLTLHTTNAIATASGIWGSAITSTVVGSTANVGIFANSTAVAYCFTPVTGYSSFGSYTGNGSADGPFVYLGFRPAFLMMKRTNAAGNWIMLDSKREGYNVDNNPLYANLINVEGTDDLADITSNGFKLRSNNTDCNASGGTYIYSAFAENPFQYARAR